MKGYLFLIIAILSMTFFSCEKETETETEKTATNNDNNNDYFYVKYQRYKTHNQYNNTETPTKTISERA